MTTRARDDCFLLLFVGLILYLVGYDSVVVNAPFVVTYSICLVEEVLLWMDMCAVAFSVVISFKLMILMSGWRLFSHGRKRVGCKSAVRHRV